MRMSQGRRWQITLLGIPFAGLWLAGLPIAQGTRPQAAPPRAQPAQTQGAVHENIDRHLADVVALANDNEIVLAKFAQTRAENKDVVKFAEMLQKDHEQFARELEHFAGNIASRRDHRGTRDQNSPRTRTDGAANNADVNANRRESAPPQAPGAAPRAQSAPGAPQAGHMGNVFLQIKQELADECLESAQHELQEKKGAEFDACYVGMQLAAHMKMIDTLKVFEKHSTPELQKVFHQGLETSQKHFDHAKKIMKGLDNVRTAQRDQDSK